MAYWISSTPMASILPSSRCSRPQVTTCSPASKTLSLEVRNASAVYFQDRRAPSGPGTTCRLWFKCVAIAPGDFFDGDGAAATAIDASHGVQQEDKESPKGDELEAPLGELIVARRGLVAARADGGGTFARPHGDLNALVVGSESSLVVDEPPKAVAAI